MAMAITANAILCLPSALLVLLLVTHYNCHHVVISAFSPSASMCSKISCLGVNNLRWPKMGHPAQQCATTIICSRSFRSVLPRRLASSSISSTDESRSKSNNDASAINDMKSLGEKLIMQAALQCGATKPMMCIEWKADRIVVTVDVTKDDNYVEEGDDDIFYGDEEDDSVFLMDGDVDGILLDSLEEGGDIMYDDEFDFDADDNVDDDIIDPQDEVGDDDYESAFESESNNNRIDISRIARTINELLAQDGEDSLSFTIAKLHEIEVTTPEFDNVLRGKRMFESYKGFDVTVEYWEEEKKKKAKKVKSKSQKDNSDDDDGDENDGGDKDSTTEKLKLKIAEGKLVGRDYDKEITMINIKGRVAKIRNDMIERVCLPKAKREKGVK